MTELADKFCAELRRRNYWADYIDPKSGQQRGCGPIQALLQYDEELAESGFKISPLGLCKVRVLTLSFVILAIYLLILQVIDNVKWDKCLVGTIYAAAPVALIMNAIKESINEFILDNVVSGFKCKLMMHIANDEDMSNKK